MLRPPASSIPQNRPTGAGGSAFTGRRLLAVLDDALSAVHLPAGARPWASVHRRSLPRCRDVRPRSGVLLRAQGSLVGEDKLTLGAYLLSTASQMARNARSANYSRQNAGATGPPCQTNPISLLLLFARCEVCIFFAPANFAVQTLACTSARLSFLEPWESRISDRQRSRGVGQDSGPSLSVLWRPCRKSSSPCSFDAP